MAHKFRRRLAGCYGSRNRSNPTGDIDGAYSWVIALASFLAHVMIYGVIWSGGVFYDLFLDVFEENSRTISLVATLSTACTFGISPLTGLLINRFGHRSMTIVGGLVAGTGLILSSYSFNVYLMTLSFGVLTGVGFGLAYLAVIAIVPLYFEKWRSVALGVAVSGVGIGTFVYPPLIRFLVHEFGIRGSLLITGGLTFNICLCGAVMRPPRSPTIVMVKSTSEYGAESPVSDGGGDFNSERSSDGSASPLKPHQHIPPKVQRKGCAALLNLHIFKNYAYVLLCVNNFLALFGIGIFYVHIVAYSESSGLVSRDTSAMLVSALGISNFVGRPFFGVLAKIPCFDALTLYIVSFTACGVCVILLPMIPAFTGTLAFSIMFGFLSASIGPLLPVIIAEILSLCLIPSGYGYLLLFEAIGSLLGPPIAGYIYDRTLTYDNSLYLSGAMIVASALVMIGPLVGRKCTRANRITLDDVIVAPTEV